MPINLYDIPKVVTLVVPESTGSNGAVLMNYPVNRTDFTIVQGIAQIVQFFIRDIDRQVINVAGVSVTINIVDPRADVLLFTQTLALQDAALSLFAMRLGPLDTLNWPISPLRYTLILTAQDGSQRPLWTDRDYRPYGVLNMLPPPVPAPAPITSLDPSTFVITDGWATSTPLSVSSYAGGVQTFAFYCSAYSGQVRLQGSLAQAPSSTPPTTAGSDWFDIIPAQNISNLTGIFPVTTNGNYQWSRVVVAVTEQALVNGPLPNVVAGTITRIVYKT